MSKIKMSLKERVALGVFMSSVPRLIELWKSSEDCNKPFDEFLQSAYDVYKKNTEKGGKK